MTVEQAIRDLLVLVPDHNMRAVVQGLLTRHHSLGIRPVEADVHVHPERDCGCRTSGAEYFRPFFNQYQYALLMFDYEGCGIVSTSPGLLEQQIENDLARAGWLNRSAVIVIDPELEIWVWSDSPHVDEELGWGNRRPALRFWLEAHNFWPAGQSKPHHPKEALEATLFDVRKPRSSAIYRSLAEKASLARCRDRAFLKFKGILSKWFEKQ